MLTNLLIVLAVFVFVFGLLTRLDPAYGHPLWDWTKRSKLIMESVVVAVVVSALIIGLVS